MSNIDKGLARARAGAATLRSVDSAAVLDGLTGAGVAVDGFAAGTPAREAMPVDRPQAAPPPALDLQRLNSVKLDPTVLEWNRIVLDDSSGASAAYKVLRTRVLQRMRRNGWKTLGVTGTCPDEGKSLTAVNLSLNLARQSGTSVVLVDMDLRKPSIHRHLGISPKYGIGDHLRAGVPLEQVAVRPGLERLGVIVNERSFSNSSEILSSPQVFELVEQVKQGEGRIAVFDLPPIFAGDDVLAFAPVVDALLIVLAQGTTKRTDLAGIRELLQNVNVVGAVLNRSSAEVAPYYYGTRY
ncbi:MAG TPA: CpsD/CapB family tyrosine-protein kinase [Gammaproteobacteria bacterium]|nr:CpsD/CapB family tyrosine-protein kinase [Gammaproteobacteria bacterium]